MQRIHLVAKTLQAGDVTETVCCFQKVVFVSYPGALDWNNLESSLKAGPGLCEMLTFEAVKNSSGFSAGVCSDSFICPHCQFDMVRPTYNFCPNCGKLSQAGGQDTLITPMPKLVNLRPYPEITPLDEIIAVAIKEALIACNRIQKDAALMLGITPRILNYRMRALGIPRKRDWISPYQPPAD